MSLVSPEVEARFHGLGRTIGNTPLLALSCTFRGRTTRVFAKSEALNLTGSLKDRVALHVLHQAYRRGALAAGAPIVETGGGNLAVSMAAVGRALGHTVHLVVEENTPAERIGLLRSFGAVVHVASGAWESLAAETVALADGMPAAFLPRTATHRDAAGAHEASTGPEIHWQLGSHGLVPQAFVAGAGTGATVMGVGRYLREHHPEVAVHAVEAVRSPSSSGEEQGGHRIEGIAGSSPTSPPSSLEADPITTAIQVEDGDAIRMAAKLAAELGLGVGISSGANVLAALQVQEALGDDAVVVTLLCDGAGRYPSSHLPGDEPAKEHHLTSQVAFHGFTAYNRVCQMCDQSDDLVRMAGG